MASGFGVRNRAGRMADRLPGTGHWIACCLGRGRQALLGRADIAELTTELGQNAFAGGTFVFRQGDPAARIHVVRTGTIELGRTINGRRVALQLLKPGDVFGDVPAFLGEPEPFDAWAVEDCTVLSPSTPTRCSGYCRRDRRWPADGSCRWPNGWPVCRAA